MVRGLLGEVDDVVERGRQRMPVVGGERALSAPAAAVEAVDDVVRDPIALLLAEQEVPGELLALGPGREQVAQQQRRPLDVAARLFEQVERHGVGSAPQEPHLLPL